MLGKVILMVYAMFECDFKELHKENCLISHFWALRFLKCAGLQSFLFLSSQ